MHNFPTFMLVYAMFTILFKTKTTFDLEGGFGYLNINFYYLLVDCELLVLEEELPERELPELERELPELERVL